MVFTFGVAPLIVFSFKLLIFCFQYLVLAFSKAVAPQRWRLDHNREWACTNGCHTASVHSEKYHGQKEQNTAKLSQKQRHSTIMYTAWQ